MYGFSGKKEVKVMETMALSKKDILEEHLSKIVDLPTLPYIVIQLFDKIHKPDPKVDELADLIMMDQVLTTQMIRLVNSAFWGLNRKITSVKETIVYLGLREISNLVYSVTLTNTFERDAPLMKRVRFWEHSFGCALSARLISKRVGYPDAELAYLAGLLHDIGESIIAIHLYHDFEKVVHLVLDRKITFHEAEDEVLGINHTDFGPWLIEKWFLPERLSEVIACHHSIEKASENKALVAIVRLADLICLYHKLDFGHPEGEDIKNEVLKTWKILVECYPKMANVNIKEFFEEFNEHIESVKQTVKAVYKMEEDGEGEE